MTNKSGQIGTRTATAVVRYLTAHGWPTAERRVLHGAADQGDITGTPNICWEIKGGHAAEQASDAQVTLWLAETETERINARANIGILVLKRKGISDARAGEWWAVMPLGCVAAALWSEGSASVPVRLVLKDACTLLHAAGYGTREDKAA